MYKIAVFDGFTAYIEEEVNKWIIQKYQKHTSNVGVSEDTYFKIISVTQSSSRAKDVVITILYRES